MITEVFKPKSHQEVVNSIQNMNLPSYRFSSFLNIIDNVKASKYRNWCITVFHTNPNDMEVRQFYEGSPWFPVIQQAVGSGGSSFASNANLRLMRLHNNYYAYPKGEIENIIIKYYK